METSEANHLQQTQLLKDQLEKAEENNLQQKELLKQELKSTQDEKDALVATLKQMQTRLSSSSAPDPAKVRKENLEKVSENFRKSSHIKVFDPSLKSAKDWLDSSLTEISMLCTNYGLDETTLVDSEKNTDHKV